MTYTSLPSSASSGEFSTVGSHATTTVCPARLSSSTLLTSLASTLPCIQGWGSLVPPTRHHPHQTSPQASWHLGQQWLQECHPSPQASCPQGPQSWHAHPSPQALWPWGPAGWIKQQKYPCYVTTNRRHTALMHPCSA